MIYKIEVAIGFLDRNRKATPLKDQDEAVDMMGELLSEMFGGVTMNRGYGYWKGQREPNVTMYSYSALPVTNEQREKILATSADIARLLNQESVMVAFSKSQGSINFVEADGKVFEFAA